MVAKAGDFSEESHSTKKSGFLGAFREQRSLSNRISSLLRLLRAEMDFPKN